jgi:hypothetical protein
LIRLNDHYFIAWLKVVKNYNFNILNNTICVDMTYTQYSAVLKEYEQTHKPVLKEIRKVVKTLAALTSKSK